MAEAVRRYLDGASTNFRFDAEIFSLRSDDPAIACVRRQLWLLYDDLAEHCNSGKQALNAEQRAMALRVIRFLESELEYRWPPVPAWYSAARPLIWLFTLGVGAKVLDRRFGFDDTNHVWPCSSEEEVERVSGPRQRGPGVG